jgi:GlpG protein
MRHEEVSVRQRWSPSRQRAATSVLIGISVAAFFVTDHGTDVRITQFLMIATHRDAANGDVFASLFRGQVWRLVTPIFLHFDILHIVFNMLWLNDLGAVIEARRGPLFLLSMVAVIGIGSNLAQVWFVGPRFGGMSGVVYGMLGYVWLRGRFDPRSDLQLNRVIVVVMIGWLALGFVGFMSMANAAHLGGLLLGAAWGSLGSGDLGRRLGR